MEVGNGTSLRAAPRVEGSGRLMASWPIPRGDPLLIRKRKCTRTLSAAQYIRRHPGYLYFTSVDEFKAYALEQNLVGVAEQA